MCHSAIRRAIQLVAFCEYCGGMGNLLMMAQAGWLSHEETVENLTLFANEVLPRLKEYKQPVAEAPAAARVADAVQREVVHR
jgi:hypothetical protein